MSGGDLGECQLYITAHWAKNANFSDFEFALVKLAPCKIEMGSQTCNNTSTIEKQPGKEESPGKNKSRTSIISQALNLKPLKL